MIQLKNILKKFNLNPKLTEALLNLDFEEDIFDKYHTETRGKNKFIVLRGSINTDMGISPQELVIDEQNQKVVLYGYPFNDTEYEGAPIFYEEYDKKGNVIGI